MYIVIPRATTEKRIQRGIVKSAINRLKWNTEKCSHNPKEGRKGEREEQKTEGTSRKQRIKW